MNRNTKKHSLTSAGVYVDHEAFEAISQGGNPFAMTVYIYLKNLQGDGEYAAPAKSDMCEHLGKSKPTVDKALGKLEDLGLITIMHRWQDPDGTILYDEPPNLQTFYTLTTAYAVYEQPIWMI